MNRLLLQLLSLVAAAAVVVVIVVVVAQRKHRREGQETLKRFVGSVFQVLSFFSFGVVCCFV